MTGTAGSPGRAPKACPASAFWRTARAQAGRRWELLLEVQAIAICNVRQRSISCPAARTASPALSMAP